MSRVEVFIVWFVKILINWNLIFPLFWEISSNLLDHIILVLMKTRNLEIGLRKATK